MLKEKSSLVFGLAVVGIVGVAVGAVAPWGFYFVTVHGFDSDGEWVLAGAALSAFALDRHGRDPASTGWLLAMSVGSVLALAKGVDNLFTFTGDSGQLVDSSGDSIPYTVGWGTYCMIGAGAVLAAALVLMWGAQKRDPSP